MIVRTYARRNRCINSSYSDSGLNDGVDECSREPLSQESSQEIYSLPFSSQDSSHWAFDSDFGGSNPSQASLSVLPPRVPAGDSSSQGNGGSPNRKFKKPRCITQEAEETEDTQFLISKGVRSLSLPSTSTLMEAQEFGEMMEHVDEVNFALDGLRKGQPYRIRRASLLSLLSICATAQQRRLLRTQGMAKTIIDAILALTFDDSASTLAAAALFYIFASDGQDEQLLASPICIHFLLKLLKPPAPDNTVKKMPTISSKLLALRKDPGILRDPSGKLDSSSTAIISKVQEILVSCKEMKSNNVQGEDGLGRPELSPKWVALLTMEKACLTTISLEDTSDTMRRVGGDFKEKLRELGGLDAIFDVVLNCHSIMKGWLERSSPSTWELKDGVALQSVVLLLKCLKIMENATFLSKDNQNYLLGMNAELNHEASALSFVGLILSVINILSGLSLLQHSSFISNSDGTGHDSEIPLIDNEKVDQYSDLSSKSSRRCCSLKVSHVNGFEVSRRRPSLSTSQTSFSVSSVETSSCNRTSRSSKINVDLSKRANFTETIKHESLEENEDPFAFDEDELELSKWELLSMRKTVSRTQKGRVPSKKVESGGEHELVTIHPTSSNGENLLSCEISSSAVEQENSNLLPDCLLTAVKVLMNLTNDNPLGCQQIGACGGLETMSTLIIGHFPSFSSCLCSSSEVKDNLFSESITELHNQKGRHLTDQELDFLVAILGLLVNMVEKDGQNRSRLAAASVSLPSSGGLQGKESHKDVIPLLCSIFLSNQGSGEAAEEAKVLPWNDDDDVVLQGEREAEKMIIEAYAALLLAFLSTESKKTRDAISSYLPDHNLKVLVPVLERFVEFHLTLNMISPETHTAVSEVIESCRVP